MGCAVSDEINIFKALDFIRDHAESYAKAKAERVYIEEYRKTKKAVLMQAAELEGHKSSAAQEREAYAHPEYEALLLGLRDAVAEEERLRWQIEAAKIKCEVWRTLNANMRTEKNFLGG